MASEVVFHEGETLNGDAGLTALEAHFDCLSRAKSTRKVFFEPIDSRGSTASCPPVRPRGILYVPRTGKALNDSIPRFTLGR